MDLLENIPRKGAATFIEKLEEEHRKFVEEYKDKYQPHYFEEQLVKLAAENEKKIENYRRNLRKIRDMYFSKRCVEYEYDDNIDRQALQDFKYFMKQKGYTINESSSSREKSDFLDGRIIVTTYTINFN